MTTYRMPGGGRAWFVRVKKRLGCGLRPVSREGQLLTGAYAAWVALVTAFFVADDPGTAEIVAAVAILASSTILYIVTALRMSAPASSDAKGKHSCS